MTDVLNPTIILRLAMDVSEASRRNDHMAQLRFSTDGNFTKIERQLPAGESIDLPIPAKVVYVLSGDTPTTLRVEWSGDNAGSRTFTVDKMMFLSDMSDVSELRLTNTGAISNAIKVFLF